MSAGWLLHKREMSSISILNSLHCLFKSLFAKLNHFTACETCHITHTLPIFRMIVGAPCSYSASMLEDISGTFKRGFHGNHYICSKFFIIFWLKEKSTNFL